MNKVKKVLVLVLIAAIVSLGVMGCKKKGVPPAGETTTGEHPEHPSEETTTGEDPAKEDPVKEQPE